MIASICSVLVVLWPLGLPALLFFNIRRAVPLIQQGDEDTLDFWDFAIGVRTQQLLLSTHARHDIVCDTATCHVVHGLTCRRVAAAAPCTCLLAWAQDYDEDHWYWEVVELLRKMT